VREQERELREGHQSVIMEKTLQIINQMKDDGLFTGYAIGGAESRLFFISSPRIENGWRGL
jgi:hypothetical protein